MEPVDLNEAAQEVIARSSSDLQRNGVIVQTEFAQDVQQIDGDRVQLQQVILSCTERFPRHERIDGPLKKN